MIILADNTTYTIKDNLDEYLPLQSIANKTISDLLSNSGNACSYILILFIVVKMRPISNHC